MTISCTKGIETLSLKLNTIAGGFCFSLPKKEFKSNAGTKVYDVPEI
jgi:hypothetical protein